MTRKQNTMFSIDSCGILLCKLLLTVLCRENDNWSVEIRTLEPNHMAPKPAEGAQYSDTHTGERLGSVELWEVTTGCATHHISSRPQQSACFAVNSICFCVLIFSVFFLEYFWLTVGEQQWQTEKVEQWSQPAQIRCTQEDVVEPCVLWCVWSMSLHPGKAFRVPPWHLPRTVFPPQTPELEWQHAHCL